jgi:hypothetical protein
MSCGLMCHDIHCFNDREHLCHSNNCDPELVRALSVIRKIEQYFRALSGDNSGLSAKEVKAVHSEILSSIEKLKGE